MWHSLIGSPLVDNERKREIDTYVLIVSGVIFFLYNCFYIIWFLKMYTSIKKFHKYSINEAQNAAKKKHDFEMASALAAKAAAAARSSSTKSSSSYHHSVNHPPPPPGPTSTPIASNENISLKLQHASKSERGQRHGMITLKSPTGSVYFKKASSANLRKSLREKESSPTEPIRAKNNTALNFTDLPKP